MNVGIFISANTEMGGVFHYTQAFLDSIKNDSLNSYYIYGDYETLSKFETYNLTTIVINRKSTFLTILLRSICLLLNIRLDLLLTKKEHSYFDKIDIFYSTTVSLYPHFYAKKPFIFTLHDLQEKYFPEFFSRKERLQRYLILRALTKHCKAIICESNYVKNDIIKFTGTKAENIYVLESPPKSIFKTFSFTKEMFNKVTVIYNLPDKYIYYPAQCWKHKNHHNLILAFHKLTNEYPNISLILSGSKGPEYNSVIKLIDQLKLSDIVKHIGFVSDTDLPYIYRKSIFLVMPSLFESISIPIYEAFSLGVPVCCSNVVGLPEQVENAAQIFNPHDVDDMTESMGKLISNKDFSTKLSQRGLNKIESITSDKYIQSFNALLL
jgi:glycosyltransferase involved in cell wall biosynthesis